jgi:hypothetical protein
MKIARWYKIAMLLLVATMLLPLQLSCGGGGGDGGGGTAKGTITTGTPVSLAEQGIGPSGGTVTVDKPNDPLNGLQIDVPADAYTSTQTFEISYAPIEGHTFGSNFNPISPLITIENGGGYADDVMTITIPVNISEGQFAMAFYYDEQKGKLEGVPLISENSTSITISTMHCSKFVVTSIAMSMLTGTIDSGFKPGTDDWQFPNHGSYIAPKGHCAGQSLTAMWYYCEKAENGEARLYGLYDNNGGTKTPSLWQDDSLGYRFASTIQKDVNWDSLSRKIFKKYLAGYSDELTWKAFAYSILLTGEPQYIEIWNTPVGGGHTMIVYAVTGGTLHIADPNYPGDTDRKIEFINGSFKAYSSGASATDIAAGNGKAYDRIIYIAKTAVIDFGPIASRWTEFESKTIGNDKFPAYTLQVLENSSVTYPLEDGFNTDEKMLHVTIDCGFTAGFFTYREGVLVDNNGWIELKPQNNELGFYILGQVNGNWEWVDFKYINVYYEAAEATLTPKPSGGHPIINSISGPTEIWCTAYPGPNMHYSIDVSGGTPPYYVTWKAGVKILQEGSGLTSVDIPCGDLRDNGEGYWIWVTVKDSTGKDALWLNDVGVYKNEFCYGVKYSPTKYQVVTEPANFPYESP